MILVDTSVWVDHLRAGNERLTALLSGGEVLGHPFVIGELALGNLRRRDAVLSDLRHLPQAVVAADEEVLHFIDRQRLFGRGIGYVDAHLLAAARLTEAANYGRAIGACKRSRPNWVWRLCCRTDPSSPGLRRRRIDRATTQFRVFAAAFEPISGWIGDGEPTALPVEARRGGWRTA